MKTEYIRTKNMRNDEHFQFMTEVKDAIKEYGGEEKLKIKEAYVLFLPLYNQEDEALKKIMKSAISDEIQQADSLRDQVFRGMTYAAMAALYSVRPDVQDAAKKIKIVLDTYGNVAQKPLNEETSAVYNLLQDLFQKYKDESMKVGIMDWLYELQNANNNFDILVKKRYKESAEKTDLILRDVRKQIDAEYKKITQIVNVQLLIADDKKLFEKFIKYLNTIIDKYNSIIAQRTGKNAKVKN